MTLTKEQAVKALTSIGFAISREVPLDWGGTRYDFNDHAEIFD